MKVLIVEDEKRLAQALGQIMEEQKYSVDIVYDGEDGLDYALSGQYDRAGCNAPEKRWFYCRLRAAQSKDFFAGSDVDSTR